MCWGCHANKNMVHHSWWYFIRNDRSWSCSSAFSSSYSNSYMHSSSTSQIVSIHCLPSTTYVLWVFWSLYVSFDICTLILFNSCYLVLPLCITITSLSEMCLEFCKKRKKSQQTVSKLVKDVYGFDKRPLRVWFRKYLPTMPPFVLLHSFFLFCWLCDCFQWNSNLQQQICSPDTEIGV